jgi:hypothetical protein
MEHWNMESPKKHRDRLRAQGMRPIQLWVTDVHSPEFARDAKAKASAVAASEHAAADQEFIDAVSDDSR